MPNKQTLIQVLFILGFLTTSASIASTANKARFSSLSGRVFKTLASFDGTDGTLPQ